MKNLLIAAGLIGSVILLKKIHDKETTFEGMPRSFPPPWESLHRNREDGQPRPDFPWPPQYRNMRWN